MSNDACASCTGACCHEILVRVNGFDVWRIARAQRLAPRTFLDTGDEREASDAGVLIAEVEQPVGLYLKWSSRIPGACEFLVHFPGDERRCGIYAERPGACSVYPMQLRTGTLDLRADMRCKPTDWSLARVNTAGWRNALAHYQRRWIVFTRIVRVWNDARGRRGGLDAFYDFLLGTYDALPPLEQRCGIVMSDRPAPAHDVPVAEIPDSFLGDVDALAANRLSSCTPGAETTSHARP